MKNTTQALKIINKKTAINLCNIYFLGLLYFIVCIFYSESNIIIVLFPILYYLWRHFYVDLNHIKLKIIFISILTLLMIFACSSCGTNILSEYYIKKSSLFLSRSELETSIKYFQKAKRLKPDHPEVLFLQYKSAQSQKNEDKAYSFLEKAMNAGYNDIDAWYDLARLHNKYGNRDKEVLIYKRILQRNANHPEANYCLAMYYDQELHDLEKTIYHLKIARDNLPSDNIWRKRCDEILSQMENPSP